MLHTLVHSPYSCDLSALLRIAFPGDDLLLLSDGVIAGLSGSSVINSLRESPLALYALKNDIIARGLFAYFSPHISIIGYENFVKLTEKQQQQILW